jgi:V/A-type H+-transporting ATPase subunit F
MKLVVVGNEEESLGFSLAGIEGIIVEDEQMFIEEMQTLLTSRDIGVIAVVDRYFSVFSQQFSEMRKRHAVPAVIFIPSIDGTHHQTSIKEYLANILGIRL